jgi:hypothetical protein
MRRLILKAIDQWKQWRLDRAAKRVMPERVKLQERHAKARKNHKPCKHIERELKQYTLQALRGEHGTP